MSDINALTAQGVQEPNVGKDVTVLYSRGGKVQARLFTHTLIRNEAARPPYTDMADGMKVEFFDDSTRLKSTVTARYARWYEASGNILIRDSVVVINSKGEKLETQEMVWNQTIAKFFTEKAVHITTATQKLKGTCLEANEDFSQYEICNPVGDVLLPKKGMPTN